MMRSWAYNRLGVLMGTSWSVSCPHWHGLRDNSLPRITPFLSQRGFCSTAIILFVIQDIVLIVLVSILHWGIQCEDVVLLIVLPFIEAFQRRFDGLHILLNVLNVLQ